MRITGLPFTRHPIEIESPEERGYDSIRFNLTESSFTDGTLDDFEIDLGGIVLAYGDHLGHPDLRALLSEEADLQPEDALLCTGAASALFLVNSAVVGRGDHVVVVRTNYATNLTTPQLVGADVTHIDLDFADGYRLDVDRVAAAVRPETRLVSITTPHNPTGQLVAPNDVARLADITARIGTVLLVDETYRDFMADDRIGPLAASLGSHVVSVSSMSKAYGLPGLRVGWALCSDAALKERLLAAKEQVLICGAALDEEAAFQVLSRRALHRARILDIVDRRRALVAAFMAGAGAAVGLEWVAPEAGAVCFPRFRPDVAIDIDGFYEEMDELGAAVAPGHWFDTDRRNFRLGFGWPDDEQLRGGLDAIVRAANSAIVEA